MAERRPNVVLVVDDNAANRALAQATLEDEGYRVLLAGSGEDGIAAFLRDQPDCVLLDIQMPGMDGVAIPLPAAVVACWGQPCDAGAGRSNDSGLPADALPAGRHSRMVLR